MARIKESDLQQLPKKEINGKIYYAIKETEDYLQLNLKGIEQIDGYATFEAIIATKEANKELSEFDLNIKKALNFNPNKK